MSRKEMERVLDPLSRTTRDLDEAKHILEGIEATALSEVALTLTEAAENLSRTAKDLAGMQGAEWMTAEQAARHLGCESVKAFVKIASREGIPKHYLSGPRPTLQPRRTRRVAYDTPRRTP
jgi:hypothetical protein